MARKMKKDPNLIFLLLGMTLNNLKLNNEYNFNELRKKVGIHWITLKKYANLVVFIQKYFPKIDVNNKRNTIKINEISERINEFDPLEKQLLIFYLSKAFDEKSALNLEFYDDEQLNSINILKEIGFIKEYNNKAYLSLEGRNMGYILISDIYNEMEKIILVKSDQKSITEKNYTNKLNKIREDINNLKILNIYQGNVQNLSQNLIINS